MEQRKRRKLLKKKLNDTTSLLGFSHYSREFFIRERGELLDIFFFQQTIGNNKFYITYGIDCPKLLPPLRNNEVLALGDLPMLLITNGRLEQGAAYGCKYEEHIENSSRRVTTALKNEAEPWFARFTKPDDLIQQYHNCEVGISRPSDEVPPGKLIRWCIYGLMLIESEKKEGHEWLEPVLAAYKGQTKMSSHEQEWVRIIESCHP